MVDIDSNRVRGHLEAIVLACLSTEPAHGFELVKKLSDRGEGALRLKEGTIYPVLYRLEDAGLVKADWESTTTARKGPRRKIYAITAKGRSQLKLERQSWQNFVEVVGNLIGAPA